MIGSCSCVVATECEVVASRSYVEGTIHISMKGTAKPLESKPATISRKNVTAKVNASGLAVRGKAHQRPYFLNGCQWRRGFTTLNKQLFRGNG